jgi:Na+/H+ antiporter NhaA
VVFYPSFGYTCHYSGRTYRPYLPPEDDTESPLEKLEHVLSNPVNFIIMPIFAIANTNITFESGMSKGLLSGMGMGIVLGLVLGNL